jgi:hypothetical protein
MASRLPLPPREISKRGLVPTGSFRSRRAGHGTRCLRTRRDRPASPRLPCVRHRSLLHLSWELRELVRTSRSVSRILFPGASRPPVRRPSISACRRRQALAVHPQARTGRPRTPAQPPAPTDDLSTLLRVGFTEPPRSPGVLVVSYTTVSPLPRAEARGGLFSVALSRGSPRVAVDNHPALRSPDFPRRRPGDRRRGRPTDSSAERLYPHRASLLRAAQAVSSGPGTPSAGSGAGMVRKGCAVVEPAGVNEPVA